MVVLRLLALRHGGEEEVRIEALGHGLGRDPVRPVQQLVGGEHELLGLGDCSQRGGLALQLVAIPIQTRKHAWSKRRGGTRPAPPPPPPPPARPPSPTGA